MNDDQKSKGPDRRRFLLQLGSGTLAVGFGAGLTSCGQGGGSSGGALINIGDVNINLGPKININGDVNIGNNNGNGNGNGNGNNQNNSSTLVETYDPLTDTYHYENIGEEDVVIATYDVEQVDGVPTPMTDEQAILAPGQSFSCLSTSEFAGVITNTSIDDIQLGSNRVLPPGHTFDFGA